MTFGPQPPMGNYPYAAALGDGPAEPAGARGALGIVEGLKVPAMVPLLRPPLRHRQAMEAGLVAPPWGEVKAESGAAATSVYQQLVRSRLQLSGHQLQPGSPCECAGVEEGRVGGALAKGGAAAAKIKRGIMQ